MPNNWSREEVEATVSDYFDMLAKELRGDNFNKAEHNRNLQIFLNHRTKAAIEKKHQNISAVLIELGYPYVDGYKPLQNYQSLLRDVVEERLVGATNLQRAASVAVNKLVEKPPQISDMQSILVPPPEPEEDKPFLHDKRSQTRTPVRRNYLEDESRNQSLGLAGEKFILEFEHLRLWRAGKKKFANHIEHVAHTQGDHLGYDIVSYDMDGKERLIEVKTTRFGKMTPFFASQNEVDVSACREERYKIYRLFNFIRQPKLFILDGSLSQTCRLRPIQCSAVPR
jgi:hypothetical protein